jgi:hypothetical protein
MVGGTDNPLDMLGIAFRADHLHGLTFVHDEYFKKRFTLKAFEFVYRHPITPYP